jgi:hypothetical protein
LQANVGLRCCPLIAAHLISLPPALLRGCPASFSASPPPQIAPWFGCCTPRVHLCCVGLSLAPPRLVGGAHQMEVKVLLHLASLPCAAGGTLGSRTRCGLATCGSCSIVQLLHTFSYRGHLVLVFELLGVSMCVLGSPSIACLPSPSVVHQTAMEVLGVGVGGRGQSGAVGRKSALIAQQVQLPAFPTSLVLPLLT